MNHGPDDRSTADRIVGLARDGGFDLAGIASMEALKDPHLDAWLERGFHGEMRYLTHHATRRRDPKILFKRVESVLAVAAEYGDGGDSPTDAAVGNISRYAIIDDYHVTLGERLRAVEMKIRGAFPAIHTRAFVDAGPFNEKHAAVMAGLGFIGKHTNFIRQGRGSWFFLGMILLGAKLPPTGSLAKDRCGHCTRCIAACPTDAIVAPYVLDARRCISYLTIELEGPIPLEFREAIGNRIFGCDDCQLVCPWNRFAQRPASEPFQPRAGLQGRTLESWLASSEADFTATFRGSTIARIGHARFLRNVLIAAGNSGDGGLVPAVTRALSHRAPVVRGAAAWALGRLGGAAAHAALAHTSAAEADADVLHEVRAALGRSSVTAP